MEKLQTAIEKARLQREQETPLKSGPARRDVAAEAPATRSELWTGLPVLQVSPRSISRNRIIAHGGGQAAAPFDMLRTRILQHARGNGWKRVALVSTHSACGKSTTAANLAYSFGRQSDVGTIVLDLDLRRAGLAKILEQDCAHTMGDVLQGKVTFRDHACRIGDNVALGLNSRPVSNASEILQSKGASEFLDALEAEFEPDIVLFDTPPLMAVDDNFGFLKNVDCALLIVEAERTTVDQIDLAERQLAELTNVMGFVLNKSHFAETGFDYGYG